ncbi:MAG TPA: hypothetical protein PK514_07225 [Spirochaetota bacterium]|nr:hypothetical protein [Spirochaetota bacterium]
MKKIIIAALLILMAAAISGSCYDASQNATVRINLGNIPIAHHQPASFIDRVLNIFAKDAYASNAETYVQKLHIAAVSGDSILVSAGIDAVYVQDDDTGGGSFVELSVPAGKSISIVVVGEITGYVNDVLMTYINYYGYYTTDLEAGSTVTIPVQMNYADMYWINFNRQNNIPPYYLYWDKKPGAVITLTDDSGGVVYRGTGTRVYVDESVIGNTFYLTAEFEFAGVSTQTFNYGW